MGQKKIGCNTPHTTVMVSGRLQGERVAKSIQACVVTLKSMCQCHC